MQPTYMQICALSRLCTQKTLQLGYNEHMNNLGVCQIKHVIINDASSVPKPRLLNFDVFVLKTSLGASSTLGTGGPFKGVVVIAVGC